MRVNGLYGHVRSNDLRSLVLFAGFVVAFHVMAVLALGVGLLLAPLVVLVRDLERVVRIALRLGFYASPVIFAVEDVPPPELLVDDRGDPAIPLARLVPGGPERDGSTRPPRIVVFRRPLEARARHPEDLADLVHDVVVDEVARHLGLDPDVVDPPGPPES